MMHLIQPFRRALDPFVERLNRPPERKFERVFSIVRRLRNHIEGTELGHDQITHLVSELLSYVFAIPVPVPLNTDTRFCRAVQYKDPSGVGYERVSRLSYIPEGGEVQPSVGRMNANGESVFYACMGAGQNSVQAALSEVRACPGDVYNILESHVTTESDSYNPTDPSASLNLAPLGLFDYYRRGLPDPYGLHESFPKDKQPSPFANGKSSDPPGLPPAYRAVYDYLKGNLEQAGMLSMQLADAFISDVLRQKASTLLLYDLTSALSTRINRDSVCDGIIYPSVQFDGHPNVALKPARVDSKLKHVQATSVRVLEDYGYGIYKTEELAKGAIFGGCIEWSRAS
ncbi:MAG TPA: hypothetical protein VFW68_08480 [Rhodocyclaceae bacterium]|nr:hypothetical protein [Rhodocyclaceae bacterium]